MLSELFSWQSAKDFANSAFTTSLLGALAGAYAGAHGAQLIARRSKLKDDLLAEIRNVNAALAVAFSIVNVLIALKKQHVKSLADRLAAEEAKLHAYKLKRATGFIQGNATYNFQADFQTLAPVSLPTPQLVELVLAKLSTSGRPLNLAISLSGTVESLNGLIERRNQLISEFRAGKFADGADLVSMYFGLPYGGGHVNREYPDTVSGISAYLDDLIFCSHLLCKDLREHGESLAKTFKAKFGDPTPRISEVSFDTPEAKDMIPQDGNYQSILNAFKMRPKEPKKWWER